MRALIRLPRFGAITAITLCVSVGLTAVCSAPAAARSRSAHLLPHTGRYPFAGYLTTPTTVTSVSTTVVLPAVSCTKKTTAMSAAATVWDSSNGAFSSAMAYIGCSGKIESLAALVQIDNEYTEPSVTMSPGDTVDLSVTCGASGISVSIDDVTSGSTGSGSSATPETCTQGEIGNDAAAYSASAIVAPPPFGSMNFSAAMVNGAALGLITANPTTYHERKAVITPGGLTDSGTAFTTTLT